MEDGKVEQALNLIKEGCSDPVEPSIRRAIIYVQNVADYEHFYPQEELLFYRIFKEHFGELEGMSLMGRSKVTPDV